MAFAIQTTLEQVQTTLGNATDSNGDPLFYQVDIGQSELPPGEGPIAEVYGDNFAVVDTTLNSTIELHVLTVRIYRARYSEGVGQAEYGDWALVSEVMDELYGDFDVGGNVRNVDVAGQYGTPLSAERNEEVLEDTPYYVADITLPLIVDSATTLVA